MLHRYSGPRLELGMAEQFVLLLSDTPDYRVLLEGHVLQAEFQKTATEFKTSLSSLIDITKLILESEELQQILHYILTIGNYLNYVSHENKFGFEEIFKKYSLWSDIHVTTL